MMEHPLNLLLAVLALWRLTHLLQAEDGPFDLILRLRRRLGEGFWGQLMDCFYCLSLWLAVPFAAWLATSVAEGLLLWLALSGAVCLLERATARPPEPTLPLFHEDPMPPEDSP
ncbi:MAG: hypothetical protein AAGD01_05235 [Acidobacteriota bacterium]